MICGHHHDVVLASETWCRRKQLSHLSQCGVWPPPCSHTITGRSGRSCSTPFVHTFSPQAVFALGFGTLDFRQQAEHGVAFLRTAIA